MKYLRFMCNGFNGTHPESCSMTSIQVPLDDGIDFETARGRVIARLVEELLRYGLHEALGGIGIRPVDTVWVRGEQYERAPEYTNPRDGIFVNGRAYVEKSKS